MTREKAINQLGWLTCKTNEEQKLEAIDMAIEALKVDLVRCGECKYRDCCSELGDKVEADDYCSFGERRSDETDTGKSE